MKHRLFVLVAPMLLLAATACAAPRYMYAPVPPPAPRVEAWGVAPRPGMVWVTGNWGWRPGGHYWVPGRWVRPPHPRAYWVPGRWEGQGRGYYWREGRWRR